MRLYVQRAKGDPNGEPVDRYFSHSKIHTCMAKVGLLDFYRLNNEKRFENLEIGDSQDYSGSTELVRIA